MALLAILAGLSVVVAAITGQDAGAAPDAGPTPTATTPAASPAPPAEARDVRDTCAEALRRATALLDAQEDALDAFDDGQADNFARERTKVRDFNRNGLHQAAEDCRNAA